MINHGDDDDQFQSLFNTIHVKKTTVLNTLVTMTMTSDVENSKN